METLEFLEDLGPEQELEVFGNARSDVPMTAASKYYQRLFLNASAVRALRGIKRHVRVGKARGYLLFHFTDDERCLNFVSFPSGGATISIARVLSISGVRAEQLDRRTPVLIQDGFAVPYL